MPDRIVRPISTRWERAMRLASEWHREQYRRGSQTPYIVHPFGVATILDRYGFEEDVVIAGLLHDVLEDTDVSIDELQKEFGSHVASLVAACSEVKADESGVKRPWADRKREYIEVLAQAPLEARAVALADKLHNLLSILCDLEDGRPVWSVFHAERDDVLAYYRACIDRFDQEPELARLADAVREMLHTVELVDA
jgi:(p)ppGpp synthase/HD superfamily hydrolase